MITTLWRAQDYKLAINNGVNALHGGLVGFDKRVWPAVTFSSDENVGVKFVMVVADMEEGYPASLEASLALSRLWCSVDTASPREHLFTWVLAGGVVAVGGSILPHQQQRTHHDAHRPQHVQVTRACCAQCTTLVGVH